MDITQLSGLEKELIARLDHAEREIQGLGDKVDTLTEELDGTIKPTHVFRLYSGDGKLIAKAYCESEADQLVVGWVLRQASDIEVALSSLRNYEVERVGASTTEASDDRIP